MFEPGGGRELDAALALLDQYERAEAAAGRRGSSVAHYRYARLAIMCGMYSVGALVRRVGRRARTLSWLGIPLLAGGIVLTALWLIPVTTPTVHVQWADAINAEQRAAFERQRSLVNGSRREDGSWAYLLKDTSHANVALIVQASMIDSTEGIDRNRFEVRPAIVRPLLGLAPLQSFLGFGLGGLLLVGSIATTRQRRTVYAAIALALLLLGMVTAPLPLHLRFENGEWMGDYEMYTSDRAHFENYSGHTFIQLPHHLTALVLKSLDSALGATAESPARAFRWLSALAGGLFVAELLGIAILEGWSAGALRYLALCVAAPVTVFFFGFREIGYLSLSAAGIPLLLRGFSVIGRQSTVIAAACVMGLRSTFHGFGLLSLAGGALSALVSAGNVRDRLTRAVVFGVWATVAWLGWLGWYLVGLKLPVEPGTAGAIALRPLTTPYVADHRLVEPILSGSGIGDIVATAVVVGVPVLLLGLMSRGAAPRERRLALVFALPSLAFLVAWWPVQGVDNEMDLIFATFPAFFAGAWLCARTRGATVAALALASLAHAALWIVVRSDDFSAAEAPVVQVRWVQSLGDAQREMIARTLGLSSAEHDAGSIWRYRVPDLSPQRLDTIVTHEMVDDIHGFDDGPVVHVRWVEDLGDAQRTALEHALGLYRAEHRTGSTWRYQAPDAAPDRFITIAAHDMVDDTYGFDHAADARFGPRIHVRWVETVGNAQRTALERSLGLYRAEHRDGSTWHYQVPDVSPNRLRMIVAHGMVADTNGFDRVSLELDTPADDIPQFTDYRLMYTSGWHPAESDATAPESTWQWTRHSATLSFSNPNADAAFYLDYSARPDLFAGAPQTVTIRASDQVLQTFQADTAGRRLRRIPLPTTVLGTEDTVDIHIAVDRTFVPANLPAGGRDHRELGIQVYHAFVVLR